jgi:hypothetical protein
MPEQQQNHESARPTASSLILRIPEKLLAGTPAYDWAQRIATRMPTAQLNAVPLVHWP